MVQRLRWSAASVALAVLLAGGLAIRALRAGEAAKAPVAATDEKTSPGDAARADLIGRRVPSFVVKDVAAEARSLADYADKRAVVVVFLSTECPIANKYLPVISELAKKDAERSVQWLAVYSGPSDDAAKVAAHVKQYEIKITALVDSDQQGL